LTAGNAEWDPSPSSALKQQNSGKHPNQGKSHKPGPFREKRNDSRGKQRKATKKKKDVRTCATASDQLATIDYLGRWEEKSWKKKPEQTWGPRGNNYWN